MGRDHHLTKAEARPYQDQRTCYPCHRLPCQQGRLKEKGRSGTFEGLYLLLFFFFLPALPWSIKGRTWHPTDRFNTQHITQHIAKQQPSSWHHFGLFIRDLELVHLSTVCTSTTNIFLELKTRAIANWIWRHSTRISINFVTINTSSGSNAQPI